MAIEIIQKPESKKDLWAVILFIVCLVLIFALAGSYLYFLIYSKKISQDIENKKSLISRSPSEQTLEKKIISYESKINVFGRLLFEHKKTSAVFFLIEKNSHPDVWFSDFNFDVGSNTVVVSGQTKSFTSLGQQISILENMEIFKKVNLSEISIGEEEGVDFSLQLTFDSRIFE